MSVYWDIEWKDVLIHDDMLDTWWTMVTLLEKMLEKNPKSINLVITHWMFNKNAYSKLQEVIDKSNGIIKNIYISDSINKEWLPDYVKVIKSNKIITNVITNIFKWYSIDRWDNTDYTDI
jgi:phosphoribosylpyrophosphate synthetase